DGSTPSANSTPYTGPIHVTQSGWLRAIGMKPDFVPPPLVESYFTIQPGSTTIAPIVVTPPGGTFTGSVDVTLGTATSGAAIYYTLDGSTPGAGSLLYTGPIHLTASRWVRATAIKAGYASPVQVEYFFTIQTAATTPPAPLITPNGGTFSTCPSVTLSTSEAGDAI